MKRILALILALVMAFSILAACADPDTPDADPPATNGDDTPAPPAGNDNDTPPPAATEATREFVQPPPGDWDQPFPETVLISAAAPHGTNWHFRGDDDVNDNPWTRLYMDRLNVQVEFEWTAIDDYPMLMNLAIAAGDLPDVFNIGPGFDPLLFNQLVDQGMLLDLTDAYRTYASQRIQDFELTDPDTIQNFMVDGRIFGLPRYYYGQIDQPWHMWVRKDWFEAEGSPEIRTVQDLEDLMRAFMDNHGAAYGIGVNDNLQWLLRTAPMWGAYVGNIHDHQYFWMPDQTGRLRPGISFPEFEVALENWARWFDEGLISADFTAAGSEWGGRVQEDLINGVFGVHAWWQWWGWYSARPIVELTGDPDTYFIPFNLPTVDGAQPARGQIFFPNNDVIVASADFQNPAAWMRVLSLVDHMIFSPDAGLNEDELEYYMLDGMEHAMAFPFKIIDPQADMLQYIHVLHALETGDTSELFTAGMQSKYSHSRQWIDTQADPEWLGAFLQMGFDGSAYARSQHLFDTNRIVRTALWGVQPPEFGEAGATGDMLIEEIMLIIMGVRPASDWPDILEQWYAQGGQIKEDAVNARFG